MLHSLFVWNELSSEIWVFGAYRTCLKVLKSSEALASRKLVAVALCMFLLSWFFATFFLISWFCKYVHLFIYFICVFLFFLICVFSLLFSSFSYFINLFIQFIYYFLSIISYLDLLQNFYCHGIRIFYFNLSSWICLLGFVMK